jgi:hypothetical protein
MECEGSKNQRESGWDTTQQSYLQSLQPGNSLQTLSVEEKSEAHPKYGCSEGARNGQPSR